MRLLLATRNAHKLREFERLLPALALDPLPEGVDTPPEDGETYAANALIKARAAVAATGRAAIADDSGIEAEALGWAPGVRTARFAGEHATDGENLAKLAAEAPAGSRLRYVCVIAHVDADGAEHLFEGTTDGRRGRHARAGPAASATTRCSSPTATAARWPSWPTPRRTRSRTAAGRRARSRSGCQR